MTQMIEEDIRHQEKFSALFDPITGQGSVGEREKVTVSGKLLIGNYSIKRCNLWLPKEMMSDSEAVRLIGLKRPTQRHAEAFERKRIYYDFPYWAAKYVCIKRKGGGADCTLVLNYPQRKFLAAIEEQRLASQPIRIVLLKARQWGGSTLSQIYMGWMQMVRSTGLNSLIIAHQGTASDEIMDMFDRMTRAYPLWLLKEDDHWIPPTDEDDEDEKRTAKLVPVGRSRSTFRVKQRNCKIKIGTAERPNSCRGGDYNLVHLSEVGVWKKTLGKKPEDIIRAACGGVLYSPSTMIVYESTANGTGNFFHTEYMAARDNPRGQFRSIFIPWYDIEQDQLHFPSEQAKEEFAQWLFDNKDNRFEASPREESGRYLWSLWEKGATLEGINWYIAERAKHSEHSSMASECPSDDIEAFDSTGAAVFDKYQIEAFRRDCCQPLAVGDVVGVARKGQEALRDLRFVADRQGLFCVWALPGGESPLDYELVRHAALDNRPIYDHRYIVAVDIGGRSHKADWSVIVVMDRLGIINGGKVEVVAQWRGHIDMDLLAWKAVQIAAFYDNALLVIESNTLETHDTDRWVDGDQSGFILNQIKDVYPNLYERAASADSILQGQPRRYGFHTNRRTKEEVISTLVEVIRERLYIERDAHCLDEYATYERKPNSQCGAILGAHDDLVMTRAIGLHISIHEMPDPRPQRSINPVGYNMRHSFF